MSTPQQRYKVLDRIAAGGMAEVYRAESAGLEGFKKTVAIKRVLPHLSEKKQFIGMFLDEARLGANLSHSNCVQVFDIGVGDNTYFIVMEYVDGADLKAIIENFNNRGQRVPIEAACFICEKICEGLNYAHEVTDSKGEKLGIVHRDMSPPNVLITRYGEVKVVDFGLAKANSQLEKSEPGIIKGKFSYLSPEAAHGQDVDARADIFAVGIMLWEMLAGRRLFLGESDLQTVRMIQASQVPSLREFNPAVPPALDQVVQRALARDRNQRYQTARELSTDLNKVMFQLGRPVSALDISRLVEAVVSERDRKRRVQAQKDPQSLIGSLINDAMMEFTSLKGDSSNRKGVQMVGAGVKGELGSSPLNIGSFEDVQDWAGDLGLEPDSDSRPSSSGSISGGYAAGNLAALEEDAPGQPLANGVQRHAHAEAPPAASPATMSGGGAAAAAEKRGGGAGGVIYVLVAALAVAGAAGAYFAGLFP